MPRIVYLSWPAHEISGGIKMAFHHVETLRQAGFEAYVATPDAKPPTWFDTTVPILSLNQLTPAADVLVFPENHAGFLRQFAAWPNRKVVFCQNQFMVWRGLDVRRDYADFGVRDLICPAELVAAFCRRRCPQQTIHLVSNGIDHQVFHPRPPKRLQIVYAPRKRPLEAAFIRDLFQADNPSWAAIPWQPLDKLSESEVARILGESALYLSLCRFEALPLSALEALASGCVVAGFTGFGGRDYATSGNGFWAVEDDCLDAVQQLTLATRLVMEGGDRHRRLVENAQRSAAVYSPDRFARQLIECWRNLLREPSASL
jgi:glycosyltransferase involved in cell wall biosynthesis